jgi:hypothetical protein
MVRAGWSFCFGEAFDGGEADVPGGGEVGEPVGGGGEGGGLEGVEDLAAVAAGGAGGATGCDADIEDLLIKLCIIVLPSRIPGGVSFCSSWIRRS